MALIHWTHARGFVIVAITGCGGDFSVYDEYKPNINLQELTQMIDNGGLRWNYGIPNHEITEDHSALLIDWFQGQYVGGRGLKVQSKNYGGFLVNLVWNHTDAHKKNLLFNFHVAIEQQSMSIATLKSSGANKIKEEVAMKAILGGTQFPTLAEAMKQKQK
ncbi:MAG: hypothetical protein WBE72_01615 [Terracidiphilus sp.]